MIIGVPKENRQDEARVASTPDAVKKLIKKGFKVRTETFCGLKAGFLDEDYRAAGAEVATGVLFFPVILSSRSIVLRRKKSRL